MGASDQVEVMVVGKVVVMILMFVLCVSFVSFMEMVRWGVFLHWVLV